MLFNSFEYVMLLVPCLFLYWFMGSIPLRQNVVFIASLIFYASWSKGFAAMLLAMSFMNWIFGFLLDRYESKKLLSLFILANLSVLAFFKYINFLLENFFLAWGYITTYSPEKEIYLSVVLPLGISFFVFEFISYLVDIYRKDTKPTKNFVLFSLFVMFFPHLISGPICRANSIFQQFQNKINFETKFITGGLFIFVCGLFLKITIADNLSPIVNHTYENLNSSSGLEISYAAFLFSIVILCDFWGYSTMAIGSAYMFGIKLPLNFNLPYISTSLQEFWRRWHISLSSWLRDYVYISLGGSKRGTLVTYRNLFLVMMIGGIWHGAGWSFFVWGCAHGLWLVIERLSQPLTRTAIMPRTLKSVVGWCVTFIFVTLMWIPFRISNFDDVLLAFTKIFEFDLSIGNSKNIYVSLFYVCLFLICHYHINKFSNETLSREIFSKTTYLLVSFWIFLIAIIFSSSSIESFIYFQF